MLEFLEQVQNRRCGVEKSPPKAKPVNRRGRQAPVWKPEEDLKLEQMAGQFMAEEIGKRLGRSKRAVIVRAHLLGISLNTKKEWLKLDKGAQFKICGMYMDGVPSPEIARIMTELCGFEVSDYKVRSVIYRAGINNRRHRYSHDDKVLIARNYGRNNEGIMKMIGVGLYSLRNQFSRISRQAGYLRTLEREQYSPSYQLKVTEAGLK